MRVFIGLGSNLEQPIVQLQQAIQLINNLKFVSVKVCSSFYSSKPMGPQDQDDFVNAVLELDTSLSAQQLLLELNKIEQQQGRVRTRHWGPRTIDLDILVYADEVINEEKLRVPHAGLAERNFVLYPLHEIVGDDFIIPELGKMKTLLEKCPLADLHKVELTNE